MRTDHSQHALAALAFLVVTLVLVALVEHLRERRPRLGPPSARELLLGAGAVAGAVHLAVAPEHWHEAPVYGAFLLAAGLVQLGYAALLVSRPQQGLLVLNACVHALLLLVWVQSRTVGVPIGPAAGVPEHVGPLDSLVALAELVALVATVNLITTARAAVLALARIEETP